MHVLAATLCALSLERHAPQLQKNCARCKLVRTTTYPETQLQDNLLRLSASLVRALHFDFGTPCKGILLVNRLHKGKWTAQGGCNCQMACSRVQILCNGSQSWSSAHQCRAAPPPAQTRLCSCCMLAAAPRCAVPQPLLRSGSHRRGAGCAFAYSTPRTSTDPATPSENVAAAPRSPA